MTNFQFLHPEFAELVEPAKGAEQLVHSDPRACCMRTRHALEQAVHWLYENDRDLRMPYDSSLGVLLTQPSFEQLLPPHIHQKARLIQRLGNQAVHGNQHIGSGDAMRLVQELFHVLFWLARTYTRASDPKFIDARFDENCVPKLVRVDHAVTFTREELKKQEAQFREQIEAQHAQIEAREASIAETAASLAERETALAQVNAELVRVRAELARAKSANIAVPDRHDYHEADTRRFFIDVLLREADWNVGSNASAEVPLTGMPNQEGVGFADYVLWGQDGRPLAVVEAKRTFTDPGVGQQQAKLYADCLEQSTGQRPLIYYTNGHKTWLWDDGRAPPREVQGFHSREELELAVHRRHLRVDLDSLRVNRQIAGRSYQVRAVRAVAETLAQGKRGALLSMATGTGKTRTAIALVDLLMRANLVKRVLFLADRVALVKQATNAFKLHLPDSSPVNLVTDRDAQGRVFVSTYPTMMGLIEQMNGERRKYGIGHFDLIIIDEAHRSVYQKYGAIFRYFDSYLVGLTATPRTEVNHDTYRLFGLAPGVPTDTYGLEEAVKDGYLVPPRAHSVPIKFVREGIRYDDLSDEEKDHWESLDWGDRDGDGVEDEPPEEVHASEVNKHLFNENTIDLMLQHLMEHGLKVDGGDRLGKTIIFAVNQKHADFIARRFDHHYPHYKGQFARVITHSVKYAHSLIDDFGVAGKQPQIAISVDMLDTGIDVPEIVNLVFFKAVRSKVKFLQMIGRGTRLRPDLFGPGLDKQEFFIFDYCGNFEYFNQQPQGAPESTSEPLGKRLFKRRLELLGKLQSDNNTSPDNDDALTDVRAGLIDRLHGEVAAMNLDNFIVRGESEHVTRFGERAAWNELDDTVVSELKEHVAGLPSELAPEHITARLFDLLCLNLQLALIEPAGRYVTDQKKLVKLADDLESKDAIPTVKARLPLIQEVQTEQWWQDVTLPMLEEVRRKLRDLMQFVDRQAAGPIYTQLTDQIGESQEVALDGYTTGVDHALYKRKVEEYIRSNVSHAVITKLQRNEPLSTADLAELEEFIYDSDVVESRTRFEQSFGTERPLTVFIRSLIGLDRNAVREAFADFLNEHYYSSQQIHFVEMIIDSLTRNGVLDPGMLYEQPFTGLHHEGLDGLFPDAAAAAMIATIAEVNERAGL